MKTRQLGRSGIEVTEVTMGCWQAGGGSWADTDDENSVAAMRAAFDAGITSFDTAEGYGDGHSEELLAQALEGRRDKAQILTKIGPHLLTKDKVFESCENSLRRLNTDRIDLYQIHWPSGSWDTPIVPIEETMTALNALKEQGKICAIGVSNFSGAQITEALQFGRIDSLQPPYSLFWRSYENNGTTVVCLENQIAIIAYSPLAQGLLTGKFNLENRPTDNRSGNVLFSDPHYQNAINAAELLKPIAEKYGVSTGQLALQWLLGRPAVASVIVGARNVEQVRDNVRASGFEISDEDCAAIDAIGKTVTDHLPQDQTNMWA